MDICRSTALELGDKGPDIKFGYGRIDAVRAVEKALSLASPAVRLQAMMERLASQDPERAFPPRTVAAERALRGMSMMVADLDETEWNEVGRSWSAGSSQFERQAFRYFLTIRRFRAMHHDADPAGR